MGESEFIDHTRANEALSMPTIGRLEKANQFFHRILHEQTLLVSSKLGEEVPFISVFEGVMRIEFNGLVYEEAALPTGYDELKSLIHLLCAAPFCESLEERQEFLNLIADQMVQQPIDLLPQHIAHCVREAVHELQSLGDFSSCADDVRRKANKSIGDAALMVAGYISEAQKHLLEHIWSTSILPVVGSAVDELIVVVGGNRSAEAGEIVTSFFQEKFSESPGVGASGEKQVLYAHSPKTRQEMKTTAAIRLVSRRLGHLLFDDSAILQRDILSATARVA